MIVESENNPGKTEGLLVQHEGGRASAGQSPTKRRLYLHGARAALSAGIGAEYVKVTRHDAIIALTAGGEAFDIDFSDFQGRASAVGIPPQYEYSARSSEAGFLLLMVHLIHPRFRTLRAHFAGRGRLLCRGDFSHLDHAMAQACQGQLSVEGACDLIDGVLGVVLKDAEPAAPIDLRIPWVMRKLDANIDHPFEQLATELGLSSSRLSHLFSKQLGLSFRSYQSWARLRQPWEMVTQKPSISLADIARANGFADSAHLSRAFHLNMGMTPSTLRNPQVYQLMGDGLPPGQHIPSDEEMRNS